MLKHMAEKYVRCLIRTDGDRLLVCAKSPSYITSSGNQLISYNQIAMIQSKPLNACREVEVHPIPFPFVSISASLSLFSVAPLPFSLCDIKSDSRSCLKYTNHTVQAKTIPSFMNADINNININVNKISLTFVIAS